MSSKIPNPQELVNKLTEIGGDTLEVAHGLSNQVPMLSDFLKVVLWIFICLLLIT